MTLKRTGMDVKGKVLLQLFNKSKLRNRTFLEPNFFSTLKFKKLRFSAPLTCSARSICKRIKGPSQVYFLIL